MPRGSGSRTAIGGAKVRDCGTPPLCWCYASFVFHPLSVFGISVWVPLGFVLAGLVIVLAAWVSTRVLSQVRRPGAMALAPLWCAAVGAIGGVALHVSGSVGSLALGAWDTPQAFAYWLVVWLPVFALVGAACGALWGALVWLLWFLSLPWRPREDAPSRPPRGGVDNAE